VRGAEFRLSAMEGQGGSSVGSEIYAKLAKAAVVKAELLFKNAREGFSGECGCARVGRITAVRADGYTELVAEQLEDIQPEVLPGVFVNGEAPRRGQCTAVRGENGSARARNQKHIADLYLVGVCPHSTLNNDVTAWGEGKVICVVAVPHSQ
jgi:hypothetical protein